ncbi:hypothetical protein SAMN05444170_6515 [Bradyrhizobium erythrophlei]|uniref:Uncharacterized protein n=1 Tax=Bradyrhizobium erythrophlei TaxID=1437360 RepID=A0A1M7UST8_9BRAD|nr:hypothetical protein SAMN05444170_6515 [Bradyrhizobium erythrophlei]
MTAIVIADCWQRRTTSRSLLALIKLLIDEKAKDRLAHHRLHTRLSGLEASKTAPR